MQWSCIAAVVLGLAVIPAAAGAQRRPARRQAPIEIRGQVPTPQVVTVRPRAMPAYSRQILVPRFLDHDFWPDIQLGYQMVPERQISGRAAPDSLLTVRSDSAPAPARPGVSSPNASAPTTAVPGAGSTRSRPAPADTTRRTPGTAPAR